MEFREGCFLSPDALLMPNLIVFFFFMLGCYLLDQSFSLVKHSIKTYVFIFLFATF